MASQTGSYDFKAARQAYIKANAAQDAIDNLEIGGRNLLRNSKLVTGDFPSTTYANVVSLNSIYIESLRDTGWYYDVRSGQSGNPQSSGGKMIWFTETQLSNMGITYGDTVAISIDVRGKVNPSLVNNGFRVVTNDKTNAASWWYSSSPITYWGDKNLKEEISETSFIRTRQVITLPEKTSSSVELRLGFGVYVGAGDASTTYWAEVKNAKVEKGNTPTEWSPAPEDLEASIESVNERSVEYIVGTQTAATGSWTGVTTDSELKTGKTIAYKLPYAGSGNASLTLTLAGGTTTAAIPVYLSNTRVTTQFPAHSVIQMTYDGANWRATAIPDNNTYDRVRLNNAITAATAITANRIICGTDSGYKNTAAGVSFDLGYPLLFAASAIAANATGTNNYLSFPGPTATNNGTVESGAAKKTLYLKGTMSGNMFTIADAPFMTTVIPTTEDGFFYIPLGVMYDTTHIYFESSNRLYAYVNGSFQAVDVAGQILAIQSINRLNSLEPVVEQHSANFDVLQDSIMSNVEANYTRADEFNTYVDNQQSSLTQLSNSITAQFNESRELINSVNGNLETYKDDISKYIRFSAEGIEIGEEGNALTLKIDNDEIGFYKEGDQIAYWDGSTLYTGNAWITLERQFRIGNFAAIPRSDGSVSWLKVGE